MRNDRHPSRYRLASSALICPAWYLFIIPSFGCLLIGLLVVLSGCSESPGNRPPAGALPIRVAAAANLTMVFPRLEAAFEKAHPECDVVVTYGASGQLVAQLQQGAAFDLFFSADTAYPQRLQQAGLASPQDLFVYARGRLVIWSPHHAPAGLAHTGLAGLSDPSVRKLAIADPRWAPYGEAALEALRAAGIEAALQDRIVFAESVSQAAHFAMAGGADAAILAESLTESQELRSAGRFQKIPAELYAPIDQAAVVLRGGEGREGAGRLRRFIESPSGQQILQRAGYAPAGND